MANEVYTTTFQIKRGLLDTLNTKNPILKDGEPSVALDTLLFKIGDDVTPWDELPLPNQVSIEVIGNTGIVKQANQIVSYFDFPNNGDIQISSGEVVTNPEGQEPGVYLVLTLTNENKYYIKFSNTQLVGKAIDTNEIFNDYENNQTTGSYNHAEGKSTKIIGSNSHAEGENTIVYGDNSHAEGYNNIINVHQAHTEGIGNINIKQNMSHTEGSYNTALGHGVHAEGDGHAVLPEYNAVPSIDLIFSNFDTSTIEFLSANIPLNDDNKIEQGKMYKVLFDGKEYICQAVESFGGVVYLGNIHPIDSGEYSEPFAFFYNAGEGSAFSVGYTLWVFHNMLESVSDTYNIQLFQEDQVKYNAYTIFNEKLGIDITQATTDDIEQVWREGNESIGLKPKAFGVASGAYAHKEGASNLALGNTSHVEGSQNIAKGECSHAEGRKTSALALNSHAEGHSVIVSSQGSHGEGYNNIIEKTVDNNNTEVEGYNHIEGYQNIIYANGKYSHVEGIGNKNHATTGHIEGDSNVIAATGHRSHVEGKSNVASGEAIHIEGIGNSGSGRGAHIEGGANTANGQYAHVGGYASIANKNYSFSHGYYAYAYNDHQFVVGKYNLNKNNNALFVVGNGTANNNRLNAFEVLADGSAILQTQNMENPHAVVIKEYVDNLVGDIDTALDSIIAIQESLIGGESV